MTSTADIILNTLLFITLYVQVLLLFTFLEKKGGRENGLGGSPVPLSPRILPTVSIIVPCWNEEKTLAGTIDSLLALDYPKEKLEILIVDDGSTDQTLAVANSWKSHRQVRVFHKANGGKHTAMNLGLAHAHGELVGGLDADSFVEKDALMEIVRGFQNKEIMAITPSIRVFQPENILQKLQSVEYNMGTFLRKMFGEMNAIHVTPGPFSIFRKEVFEHIGGYRDAHGTEDLEIALRMHRHLLAIGNAPRAFVNTVTPSTIKTLFKQRLRWMYGFLRNAYDYRGLILNPQYGNVGLFSLPAAVFSVFTKIYLTLFALFYGVIEIFEKWSVYRAIGLSLPNASNMHMEWFFVNTNLSAIIMLALFGMGIALIFLGQRLAEGNMRFQLGHIYFLFLYGLLAPFWIFAATWNAVLAKKSSWR